MTTPADRPVLRRDPASQRRHYRLTYPAEVRLGEKVYRTRDWGLGGFGLEAHGHRIRPSDRIEAQFAVNFQGFTISFPVSVKIVRVAPSDVGARFIDLGERETALIKYFASCLVSGEIAAIGGT